MTTESASRKDPASPRPWRTALAKIEDDRILIRGHDLNDLIGTIGFAEMTLLLFTGREATKGEAAVVDAIMVAVADHGIAPSSTITRYLASCGVPLQVAVASGVMSFGDIHGGAGQEHGRLMREALLAAGPDASVEQVAAEIVADHRARKQRISGYGHPHHPGGDPRVPRLLEIARGSGVAGRYVELALAIGTALEASTGRPMRLNIDGVLAALVLDLGVDWRYIRAFIFGPRTVGLTSHVIEEWEREPGWRNVPLSDIDYDGPDVPS